MKTAALVLVFIGTCVVLGWLIAWALRLLVQGRAKRQAVKWAEAERNARWESRMTAVNGPFMEVYVERVAYIPGKTKALESILHAEIDTREPDWVLELAVAKASAADLVYQLNSDVI